MKETLLFAFANSSSDSLPALEEEYNALSEMLAARKKGDDFHIEALPFAAPDQISRFIGLHREDLVLFHYSGHAGRDLLLLKDQVARSEGIAHLLRQCPRLQVVVLNGCSTRGQVEALMDHVPVIISTSAPVQDHIACRFSINLYEALERGDSLRQGFELALGAAKTEKPIHEYRGIVTRSSASDEPLWGISYKDEAALEFTLPRKKVVPQLGSDLASVSCDRKSIIKRFDLSFERAEESGQAVAPFLLLEQPYGEAESLVKRLITNLEESRKGVKYPGFSQIRIEEVEMDGSESPQDGQTLLRKAFNRHLSAHQIRSLADFAEQIQGKFPLFSNFAYLPFAFKIKIPAASWSGLAEPFLRWMITDFLKVDAASAPKRMFICFFIIHLTGMPKAKPSGGGLFGGLFGQNKPAEPAETDLFKKLEALSRPGDPVPVTVLPPLTKVDRQDLDDWYRQFEPNQSLRDKLVDALVLRLPKTEPWNMSEVEAALRHIVEAHRNRARGI
jgi:hypothetical protein